MHRLNPAVCIWGVYCFSVGSWYILECGFITIVKVNQCMITIELDLPLFNKMQPNQNEVSREIFPFLWSMWMKARPLLKGQWNTIHSWVTSHWVFRSKIFFYKIWALILFRGEKTDPRRKTPKLTATRLPLEENWRMKFQVSKILRLSWNCLVWYPTESLCLLLFSIPRPLFTAFPFEFPLANQNSLPISCW